MKTNIFRVKEKKEKKIIIEEEKTKNPFLLFLKRNKNFILTSLIMFGICLILITTGLAFSTFQTSTDFDISFLEGSDEIISDNDPGLDDEEVEEELLGEIARAEGIVLLTKTFMDKNNNVIYYFSDKTSIIVQSDGKIYRVSSNKRKDYGINKDGIIDKSAKKILVKSTTSTLQDGTIITYYTDGSAKVEHNGITTFIRDSNNIKIDGGTTLNHLAPSRAAINKKLTKINDLTMVTYTDNTKLITNNNKQHLVNPKAQVTETESSITYDRNNTFEKISEKKLKDNNTITYFENGGAIITNTEKGSIVYVKKGGDIVIKNNAVYEIITNDYGYSKKTIKCSDGKKVTYFDNGAAIITNPDGTNLYVEDSDEILYDSNKNIISNPVTSKEISKKKTTDGYDVVNFDNGKSQVIKPDGSSFIIDTDKLIFDTSGNITDPEHEEEPEEEEEEKEEEEEEKEDPLEGMYVSDAEHIHNEPKTEEISTFIIKNNNKRTKKFRIVIEEVSDYSKYNIKKLHPRFVKFQARVGENQPEAQSLSTKTWTDENGKTNYVIYDGSIGAKKELEVAVKLYVDYENLDNNDQNKAFIGTIKVYVNE